MDDDIRDQITREDILEAIAALDRGEPHAFGPSTFYDLLEGARRYPPKAVVGLAARRALGRPLRPDEFSGGQEKWSFRLLRDRGFTIVDKQGRSSGDEPPVCLLFASGSKTRRLKFTDTADRAGSLVLASGALPPTRGGVTTTH